MTMTMTMTVLHFSLYECELDRVTRLPIESIKSSASKIIYVIFYFGFGINFKYFPDHPCLRANFNFPNANLDGMPIMNVLSWPDCAQHCSNNVDCKGFSWWPPDDIRVLPLANKACYLKNSIETPIPKRAVLSATKDCLALNPIPSPSSNPAPGPNTASTSPTPVLTDAQLFLDSEGENFRSFQNPDH